ncbi:MAG: hypothetical protein A3J06_03840 [Candidatus Moranbacteria bacterium RIFCSPLOWO2_02_FULL_48_19]|nr:MAG: hypothetical protein A3J06_03840 [Candidatus Moranbacteria bacterium RIFCSPLOWO2_02_FULL_48_19]OGI31300.1 MAG: hypothetical protein A3G09_00280 [Candidatus Moranbacteria bacterium RIFCSPLOWO2_12_FULL_48_12]
MQKKTSLIVLSMIAALVVAGSVSVSSVSAKEKSGSNPKQYKVVTPGVLSRSGLPTNKNMLRLQKLGVKSVVMLVAPGELKFYKKGDATLSQEFKQAGMKKFILPIPESFPPTDAQARRFLSIVSQPANRPVHVYCRAGNARTGTMVALYRYSIEGWSMAKAIRESKKFGGGPSKKQLAWLRHWAATHAPGSW